MKHSDDAVERWKHDRETYFQDLEKIRRDNFRYSEAMWHNIKQSLDRVGIDADKAMVAFGLTTHPLRVELERQAQEYYESLSVSDWIPTAQEYSDGLASDTGKVAAARDLFSASSTSWLLNLLDGKRAAELHELLGAAVTELQEQAELIDYRNSDFCDARNNARKLDMHCYLLSLAEVWDELVVGKSMSQRQRNNFVWVCAAPVVKTKNGLKKRNVRLFLSSGFALGQ